MLDIFWTLYITAQYWFVISNCVETENSLKKIVKPNVQECREFNMSTSLGGAKKSGGLEKDNKSKTTIHRTNLDGIRYKDNTGRPDKSILGKPTFDEKTRNDAKLQARPRALSNAATAGTETKIETNSYKLKTKELEKIRKMENTSEGMNSNERINNNSSLRTLEKASEKANLHTPIMSTTPSTSYSIKNRSSRLNPNAAVFQPNTNEREISPIVATIIPENSSDSKKLSLNPNAATFQPKIYPILKEMFLLSKRMRRIYSDFPLFEININFAEVLIVTYDCLHTYKDSDPLDDPSAINSIKIFESKSGRMIYEAYPKMEKKSEPPSRISDEVDPKIRKDVATIGDEISKKIEGSIIVGINLGKIIRKYKIRVQPFNVREITSLAKYADLLKKKTDNNRKDSFWFRSHKELLGTFLPELELELRRLPTFWGPVKMKYISILFEKLRQDWENEVEFLKRLYWYCKSKPALQLKDVMAQLGAIYPGLHCDRPYYIVDKAPSLPKELVGLHVRYDQKEKRIASITLVDYQLRRITKALVSDLDNIRIHSAGVVFGRLESVANHIFQNNNNLLNGNATIVGFDVYKLAPIIDSNRKLKGAKIYDTKIIFDAETVTELAAKYLRIDYRHQFLKNFSTAKRNENEEWDSFQACDAKIPVELAAKVSAQMFALYGLDQNRKVQALKLWE